MGEAGEGACGHSEAEGYQGEQEEGLGPERGEEEGESAEPSPDSKGEPECCDDNPASK